MNLSIAIANGVESGYPYLEEGSNMIQLLQNNPLLLLFVVAALGYPLGKIKIAGTSIGVAAVLFVGLLIGSFSPNLKLPEIIYQLGLVLFVYTIGISNGRIFFKSFSKNGVRDSLFAIILIAIAFGIAFGAAKIFHLEAGIATGMFAGALTNTPTLASILEYLQTTGLSRMLAQPVVGYSVAYPMGVIGMILAIVAVQKLWKVDYRREAAQMDTEGDINQQLTSRTIRISQQTYVGQPIQDLLQQLGWDVTFSRMKHDKHISTVMPSSVLAIGDLVTVVGELPLLETVTNTLGEVSADRLELDRNSIDFRRIAISDSTIAGHRIDELDLAGKFGAVITRLRRGDIEFTPHGSTILELGDRVRVVARREDMNAISQYFGDSYKALSEIDILTFSVGIALGMLIGLIPIPLPGGVNVQLGIAGGPLIVSLVLGAIENTGPLNWTLPYGANLTIRQVGIVLFLAGVGTRAGYAFVNTFTHGGGLIIFLIGALITFFVAFAMLIVGRFVFKVPMGILTGMLAGLQTQPAVLGFALEQSGDNLPNIGYAEVYPIATIAKIVFAQILLTVLLR